MDSPTNGDGAVVVLDRGWIVDGTGQEPFEGFLAVEGDRIVEVSHGTPGSVPSDARRIDCSGCSILPGLIDAHVHLGALDVDIAEQHRRYLPSLAALMMGRVATETLQRGFTTVRDAGGADAGFRLAIEQGVVAGPRLLVSGRPVSQTGGHGDVRRREELGGPSGVGADIGMAHLIADGADEVRRAVREELRRGADQIKLMASGGAMSPTDKLGTTQFTVPELAAAVEEAEAAGTYALAHAYTPAAIRNCVAAGVRSIEHGNLLDQPTAELMAEHGTFLVPTIVTYEMLHDHAEAAGIGGDRLEKIEAAYSAAVQGLRLAHDAHVQIASGSDLLGSLARHAARELFLQAQVLGPLGAVVAATKTNAELLGLADALGTVEPGKAADVLVVSGDILEDLTGLVDPARLRTVMKAGRVYRSSQ